MKKIAKGIIVLIVCWGVVALAPWEAQAVEGQVNINTAGAKELEKLPFIGQSRAKAIVRYRQGKGPFASIEAIRQVPDIGEGTFEAIKPYLTVAGASTLRSEAAIITQPGEVRLLTDRDYYPALETMIGQAASRIDLAMFLFKTTDSVGNRAAGLLQALIKAHQRGVAVSVLLEKSDYDPKLNRDNQQVAARLQREGIRVRFDSEKTTTHTKAVVIDRRYSLVGSHNFTASAMSHNHEASLLVDNQALANQLLEYMGNIP